MEKSGSELEQHYVTLLRELGKDSGMLGQIFVKAQNKIQDPAKLYKLIQMLNAKKWAILVADVKGDIYEGLLKMRKKGYRKYDTLIELSGKHYYS